MGADSSVIDASQRRRALDPAQSFIVQSPAGSGKTELLTQRYLGLLGGVESPEEILAITFTQKAAAEMRGRVLEALELTATQSATLPGHKRRTLQLAGRVLSRDAELGWRIREAPERLKIMTLDALCRRLALSSPLSAGMAGSAQVLTDVQAADFYRRAARATLDSMLDDSGHGRSIDVVLRHLDDGVDHFTRTLSALLARRDQWLPRVGIIGKSDRETLRATLERALALLITPALERVASAFPQTMHATLMALVAGAASRVTATETPHLLDAWRAPAHWPGGELSDLGRWRALADLLLVKDEAKWRRTVNKNLGFPPSAKEDKLAMLELLAALRDDQQLCVALDAVRRLPAPVYPDEQWQSLLALLNVLPLAVAELRRLFAVENRTDYVELAQGAREALGSETDPTTLGLSLEYRIRHILVDEMQDTSAAQYHLLRKLTAGWSPGDGHSLFCVGDPMQSIYRFREAEVGRFVQAREHGIGAVRLTPLYLKTNFRSSAPIVEWCNAAFARIFPDRDDLIDGAVAYADFVAAAESDVADVDDDSGVVVHPVYGSEAEREAQITLAIIAESLERGRAEIGVLVRSRTHLTELIRLLQAHNLPFDSVEIQKLTDSPEVQDLIAIARALVHEGDRIAWLALLRGPWAGISLEHLQILIGDDLDSSVWQLISDDERLRRLPSAERESIEFVRSSITALRHCGPHLLSLRERVERLWFELGAPLALNSNDAVNNAYRFLDILEQLSDGRDSFDPVDLEAALESERVSYTAADAVRLQLMTIHRAKGLEFDTVILPGLGRASRADTPALMNWAMLSTADDEPVMLISMAPSRRDPGSDALHDYLGFIEKARAAYELDRLLYVACTRAKRSLHLVGHVGRGDDGELKPPTPRSLLARLWPVVCGDFDDGHSAAAGRDDLNAATPQDALVCWPAAGRFAPATSRPAPLADPRASLPATPAMPAATDAIEFSWVGAAARSVGTVVHIWLQRLACYSGRGVAEQAHAGGESAQRKLLTSLGVGAEQLDTALAAVRRAIANTLADRNGRWLLFGPHQFEATELALSGVAGGELRRIVIDRVFETATGEHWIVDYKTSTHAGGGRQEFLDREVERYRVQMTAYADLYGRYRNTSPRAALYFPLLQEFIELDPG